MIPRTIHHVWTSGDFAPAKFTAGRLSFMEKNPDYSFRFWYVDELLALLADEPAIITETLRRRDVPYVLKSDIFRCLVLFECGGIYVDTDFVCLKSFDPLIYSRDFCGISPDPDRPGNALMGSERKNPLMLEIAVATCKEIKNSLDVRNTQFILDAGVNTAAKYLSNMSTIYPKHFFYPFSWNELHRRGEEFPLSYAMHLWFGMDEDGWTRASINSATGK